MQEVPICCQTSCTDFVAWHSTLFFALQIIIFRYESSLETFKCMDLPILRAAKQTQLMFLACLCFPFIWHISSIVFLKTANLSVQLRARWTMCRGRMLVIRNVSFFQALWRGSEWDCGMRTGGEVSHFPSCCFLGKSLLPGGKHLLYVTSQITRPFRLLRELNWGSVFCCKNAMSEGPSLTKPVSSWSLLGLLLKKAVHSRMSLLYVAQFCACFIRSEPNWFVVVMRFLHNQIDFIGWFVLSWHQVLPKDMRCFVFILFCCYK